MTEEQFWELIEKCKDSEEPEVGVKELLMKLQPEEIESYQTNFDEKFDKAYIWDLWAVAYIVGEGCSDDGFTDFRYGLISKGKEIYQTGVTSPDSLADFELGDIENESFGYVAQEVYEEKTSQELPRGESQHPADPIGDDWDFDDEDECLKRMPKISKKLLD
ncbi:MAG: hypothetical protein COA79_22800 [Planctomycetota bacterium]|nr:MAG: hypothetical protein COA79_22800 [Planctomycetota bacterium]